MEMALETKIVLWFVLVGLAVALLHWKMAFESIEDLISRERVVGPWKAPWAVAIIFLTCVGSLVYMTAHPDIGTQSQPEDDRGYDDPWQIKRYK